jgi:hypothetical protein
MRVLPPSFDAKAIDPTRTHLLLALQDRVVSIDVRAPRRLLDEVRRRFHVGAARIERVAFSLGVVDGVPAWDAFVKDSSISYRANTHGGDVRSCRNGLCS